MREKLRIKLLEKLATDSRSAHEIVAMLGISQPTLSRLINDLGDSVVRLGRGRATRYARPRLIRGASSTFPVYQIDKKGDAHRIGLMRTLVSGQYWWQSADQNENRLFGHLPWFIQDMRPDGFVGRAFAQKLGTELGLPGRLNDWDDDDVLIALSRRGEDHIGNLIVGDESINRYLVSAQRQVAPISQVGRHQAYADLAQAALSGDPAGSSAGGEQPKFAALLGEGAEYRHVLVKFSPSLSTLEGQRWADLLHCEHLALETIRSKAIAAANTRILTSGNRVFLEVERFDRIGRSGRTPIVSLRAIDSEYVGIGDNWAKCAARLLQIGVLSPEDARAICWLKAFGDLIGNTDMHLGNLSLVPAKANAYSLAPVYDMLPMLYRPLNAETPKRDFTPLPPAMETADVWQSAMQGAVEFWKKASMEPGISSEFRQICRDNLAILLRLEAGPKIVL